MTRASLVSALGGTIASLLQASCGGPADGRAAVDAGPTQGAHLLFLREGVPGPWWRSGASQEMFDAEFGLCLTRSKEARTGPGVSDAADAAYRSFLECMDQLSWVRGLPPKNERRPAQG